MSTIEDALTWSGSGLTLSMFLVHQSPVTECAMSHGSNRPKRVRRYELEDLDGVLRGRRVLEWDADFERMPARLDEYLTACLQEAREAGAEIAWFGFEGSFDFKFLLAGDIASQIYAVADDEGVSIATDAILRSDAWKSRVLRARQRTLA
jgi:hypothetical protein